MAVAAASGFLGAMLYRSWADARAVGRWRAEQDAKAAKATKKPASTATGPDPIRAILQAHPAVAAPVRNMPTPPGGSARYPDANAPANFYG